MNDLSAMLPIGEDSFEESFHDLMRRIRSGSEDAAWELFRDYGDYMRRAVRRVLDQRLRPKFDSIDFVQLAWMSFFRMRQDAERFEKPQHLVKFLAEVASNKVRAENRRRLDTDRYGVARESSLDRFSGDNDPHTPLSSDPPPVECAIARERWEQLVHGHPARYRKIINLRLQGYTLDEIATRLKLDRGTVHRFLKKLLSDAQP